MDITMSKRFAALVKRYHTWPVLREQTVAEHTFHVLRIYDELFGLPTVTVTRAIMYHDFGEVRTGDAPFPVKRDNPDLKAAYDRVEGEHRIALLGTDPDDVISETTARRIKICDLLEMWEYGLEEMLKGNSLAAPVVERTLRIALELCTPEDRQRVEDFVQRETL